MKPIIAFDYDGVLADTFAANLLFINKGMAFVGSDAVVTPEHFEAVDEISFEQVTTLAGFEKELFAPFMQFVIAEGHEVIAVSELFEGMKKLLQSLRGKAHIVVVSNNHSMVVTEVLNRLGVTALFDRITGGEKSELKEQRLVQACNDFGVDRKNCWMVGDGVNDIESAHTAGCKSIAVSWGFQSLEKLERFNPTKSVKSVDELQDFLMGTLS